MKKIIAFLLLATTIFGCNWFKSEPEIAKVLAEHFHNKLYKKFDTAVYIPIFKAKLANEGHRFSNEKIIDAHFKKGDYLPELVTKFYVNGGLDSLRNYISHSNQDGFNPEIFQLKKLDGLLAQLKANKFKSINEVYQVVAELELTAAQSLLKYTSFVHYGSINPRNFFNRYYIKIKRPDSLMMDSLLRTSDIVESLKNAQQTSKSYTDLKKQLAYYRDSLKDENNMAIKIIKLNLERMRWQLPIETKEKVVVNIPDFSLTWFNGSDTLTRMNVCVGGKREAAYTEKMKLFAQSGKLDDKPKNHETPQLFSVFNAIQVNPIWNIPVSIAKSEIYWMARKDPYYLSNSNINVYYKGKLVSDPDTIDWNKYPREKLPFQFKQGSGEGNALGKFKFIFDNSSSIYLHDTNNKYAFKLANRAISHGCVRVENPLKFAELMVRDKYQYDQLRMEVNLPPIDTNRKKEFLKKMAIKTDTLKTFKLKPAWFATRKNVAVFIAYYTAWAENGKVQFRPDVYQYDDRLWSVIKKYML